MLARARCTLIACLVLAACSGDDDPDLAYEADEGPIGEGDGDGDGDGDADDDDPTMADPDGDPADACQDGGEALATGLAIREISMYQVVKIPIFENGAWVSNRVAPVVQGKKSLVRVFVEAQADYTPHSLRAVLTLDNGSGPKWITDDAAPAGSSVETDAKSTFNFQVDAADVTGSTRFSVALVEKSCPSEVGSASLARFPASGTQDLEANHIGKLRIKVVPVRLSNGIVPDTSATQLEEMRSTFLAHYPVSEVEITVEPMLEWNSEVGAFGNGWGELLQEIIDMRAGNGAGADEYYYGLIMPENSLQAFCSSGCVLGLAPGSDANTPNPYLQGALGIGYQHPETHLTMVHEVAHTHGRLHAPCAPGGQIQGIDSGYPDSTANTGTWGWDSRVNQLHPPSTWVSAYTYAALARRSTLVNKALPSFSTEEWAHLVMLDDDRARWGRTLTRGTPRGNLETAYVLDASGKKVAEIQVQRTALTEGVTDQFLALPRPKQNWATIVLHDREIALKNVKAPAR
jgi:hypothetical protein